jgi:hypothetical protein
MKLPVFQDPVTGEPSFSITVAAVTFTIVMTKWLIGAVKIFGHTFAPVTESEINTWLTPTLIFYLVRQGTKAAEAVGMARSPQSQVNP